MRRIVQVLSIIILLGAFNISLQAKDVDFTGLWEQRQIDYWGQSAYYISRSPNANIRFTAYSEPEIRIEYIASAEFGDMEICFNLWDYENELNICEIIPNPDYEEEQILFYQTDYREVMDDAVDVDDYVAAITIRPATDRPMSFMQVIDDFGVDSRSYIGERYYSYPEYISTNTQYLRYRGVWQLVRTPNALGGGYLASVTPNNSISFVVDGGNIVFQRTVGGIYGDGTSQSEVRICLKYADTTYSDNEPECTDINNDAPFENYYQPIFLSHSERFNEEMHVHISALSDIPISIDDIIRDNQYYQSKPMSPINPRFEYSGNWQLIPVLNGLLNHYYYSDDPEAEVRLTSRSFALYMDSNAPTTGDIEVCSSSDEIESGEHCRFISQELPFDLVFALGHNPSLRNIGNGINIAGIKNYDFYSTTYVGNWDEISVNYGTEDNPLVIDSMITSENHAVVGTIFERSGFIIRSGPQSTGTLRVCVDTEYQDTCQLVNLDDLADPGLSRFGFDNTILHEVRIYLVDGVFDFVGFKFFE